MMSQLIAMIGIGVLLCLGAHAQQSSPYGNAEFGDVSELKELHRVFVTTDDLKIRDSIIMELSKYKGLTVVNRMENAEIRIGFEGQYQSRTSIFGQSDRFHKSQLVASIRGYNDPNGRPRLRIVWHVNLTGKDVPSRGAKELIKALKKVRNEK